MKPTDILSILAKKDPDKFSSLIDIYTKITDEMSLAPVVYAMVKKQPAYMQRSTDPVPVILPDAEIRTIVFLVGYHTSLVIDTEVDKVLHKLNPPRTNATEQLCIELIKELSAIAILSRASYEKDRYWDTREDKNAYEFARKVHAQRVAAVMSEFLQQMEKHTP